MERNGEWRNAYELVLSNLGDELDLKEVRERAVPRMTPGFLSEQLDNWHYHY